MRIRFPRVRIDYPRAGRTGVRRLLPSWRQWTCVALLVLAGLTAGVVQLYRSADVAAVVPPQATTLYYSDGQTVISRFGENRTNVALVDVPQTLQDAVLAAEDRDFYSHNGFSVSGIARAAWKQATGGSKQGGSTITQQYAKNAYLTQERTVQRKLKELVLSVKIDRTRPKAQILEDYLNTIYFGRGAYGVEAASQAYFRRSVDDLNLGQAAVIASILRSPGYYDPDDDAGRGRLEERWAYVLNAMVEEGWLTQERRDRATFPRIRKPRSFGSLAGTRGYLVDMVKQELATIGFDDDELAQGGLEVVTTFDEDLQAAAVSAVEGGIPSTGSDGVRAGLVSMDARTGAVLAVYGGEDYTKEYNAATVGRAQAGSTFKPFGLVAALRDGVSLYDRFDGNSPATFDLPEGGTYPSTGRGIVNFGGASYGSSVSLLTATQRSINTAYVDVNLQVGPEKLIEVAEAAGLPKDTPGLQEAQGNNVLGFASPRVVDMASAYATLANEGVRTERHVISEVRNNNGGVLYSATPDPERVLPADAVSDANYALQSVVRSGTATGARVLGRSVAGKTGTTNDNKSAWFVGYTPQVVTAVGLYRENEKGTPLSLNGLGGRYDVTGGSFPLSIWVAYMRTAIADLPVEEFSRPMGGSVPVSTQQPTKKDRRTKSPRASTSAPATPSAPATSSAPAPATSTSAPPSTSAPATPTASATEDPPDEDG